MHPVFQLPLDTLTAVHLLDLCNQQVPEGQHVDFKEALSGKKGNDAWHSGASKPSDRARNELLRHIVGFANADGGTLLVGIRESGDSPPRAVEICPVERCHDLAIWFEDVLRNSVDPPLPRYEVCGVSTDEESGGVLVIRVPSSRAAPHRVTGTLEAFSRRGRSTTPMTMTDIQRLTLERALQLKMGEDPQRRIAVNELALLQSEAIHEIWNRPVSSDAEVDSLEQYDIGWQRRVAAILERDFSKAEVVHFTRLGVVPMTFRDGTFNAKHAKILREYALREDRLRDIVTRFSK